MRPLASLSRVLRSATALLHGPARSTAAILRRRPEGRRPTYRPSLDVLDARIVPTITLNLQNLTGLPAAQYGVYVVGYSVSNGLYLDATSQAAGTPGQFATGLAGKTYLTPVALSAINNSISIPQNLTINGGRLYFFVAPLTNGDPDPFIDTGLQVTSGGGINQPVAGSTTYTYQGTGAPTVPLPIFDIVEPTYIPSNPPTPVQPNTGLTIDTSAVDQFGLPITISAPGQTSVGNTPPGAPGAPPPYLRNDVFTAYSTFMAQHTGGSAFAGLAFGNNFGIESPDDAINYNTPDAGPGTLSGWWDNTLNSFFSSATGTLTITGLPAYTNPSTGLPFATTYTGTFVSAGVNSYFQFSPVGSGVDPSQFRIYSPFATINGYNTVNASYQVFANPANGVFLLPTDTAGTPLTVNSNFWQIASQTGNQINEALNRGVALLGVGTQNWSNETKWYPNNQTSNLYAAFFHTATTTGTPSGTPFYVPPSAAVQAASGFTMTQAYTFALDENPAPNPNLPAQPNVPSKINNLPDGTTVTITLDPWQSGVGPGPGPGPGPVNNVSSLTAVGAGAGAGPQVNIYNAQTGALITSFDAFPSFFTGGVRVAVGDTDGDGFPDIIAGAGPGGAPQVNVFSGRTFQLMYSFYAMPSFFTGGVFVAAGDVNGDGYADIVVGADKGGGPQVDVFNGKDGTLLAQFYATAPSFTGGIRVAVGDLNGTGFDQVIAVAGPGGGPQVTVFDGHSLRVVNAFYALPSFFTGGLWVGTGDLDGNGFADIIIGVDHGLPQVSAFSGPSALAGANPTVLSAFFAFPTSFTGGVRVASAPDTQSTNLLQADILAAAGPGAAPQVSTFDGLTGQLEGAFDALPAFFTGGTFVDSHWFAKG